jgi:hypothetical protein
MVEPAPGRFRRDREPRTRWLPAHQKRAGVGCWAANRSYMARARIKRWKRTDPFDPEQLAEFAAAMAGLIRAWSPILPPGRSSRSRRKGRVRRDPTWPTPSGGIAQGSG